MKDNGTDRDIALLMANALSDIATLVGTINTNLYVPAIVMQPVSAEDVSLNDEVTFAVVAVNATAYQWQRKDPGGTWVDATSAGADTASWTFTVTAAAFFTRSYRCKITGKDGSTIYTNEVQIVEAEAEG